MGKYKKIITLIIVNLLTISLLVSLFILDVYYGISIKYKFITWTTFIMFIVSIILGLNESIKLQLKKCKIFFKSFLIVPIISIFGLLFMGRGMEIILIIGSFIGIFFENITYYNKNDIKIENVNIGFNPLCYRMYESKLIFNYSIGYFCTESDFDQFKILGIKQVNKKEYNLILDSNKIEKIELSGN